MSQVRICDCCGRNLEIEDHDNLKAISDLILPENEHLHEEIICENCAYSQVLDKT